MVAVAELEEFVEGDENVITSGSTWKAIWQMSWPSLVQMLVIAVASFADIWVAGKLGSNVQAAIGIGGQIWHLMMMLAVALSAGATALVSRFWGAKDMEKAIEAARNCITFAIVFGLGTVLVGLAGGRLLFHALGASPLVESLGWDYLKFDLWSQLPFTVLWVTNSMFRAKGNARAPMAIWILMTALVILGDLTLCLGPLHFGIAGIGISWTFAAFVGVTVALVLLRRSEIGACLDPKALLHNGLSRDWCKRLLKIGLPACIQDIAWIGGNFVLFLIFALTAEPTACQAAWSVGLRLEEMVAGMPIYALSMAVGTIVGQNLGAKRPDRAELAGWQVAIIGGGYNAICGLIMFVFAHQIASLMSTDARVIDLTAQYLQALGIAEPFIAAWLCLFGAMQGAGYTKWPMWASAVCLTGIRLPLAYCLTVSFSMGAMGTWIAISSTAVLVGLIAIWRYRSGVWKYQVV